MVGMLISSQLPGTKRVKHSLSIPQSPLLSPVQTQNTPSHLPTSTSISPRKPLSHFTRITRSVANRCALAKKDGTSFLSVPNPRRAVPRPSAMPQSPSVNDVTVQFDRSAEYAVLISMYEVYNDRIYDLLSNASGSGKVSTAKRRALLFKSTERSPDRKVVAGLRKIICGSLEDALMVLETGLTERRVAGTGSNAVSSRSHGFFCVEVKKRYHSSAPWTGSTLSIVDLAGLCLPPHKKSIPKLTANQVPNAHVKPKLQGQPWQKLAKSTNPLCISANVCNYSQMLQTIRPRPLFPSASANSLSFSSRTRLGRTIITDPRNPS